MKFSDKQIIETGLNRFLQSRAQPALPSTTPLASSRSRLLFAADATASRCCAWEAAKKLRDVLFQ
jgi:hypothetical protein